MAVNQTAARNCGTPDLCCSWNLHGEIGVLPFIYISFFCLSSLVSVALTSFPWQSSDMKMCESVALKHGSNASKCESDSHSTQCNFCPNYSVTIILKSWHFEFQAKYKPMVPLSSEKLKVQNHLPYRSSHQKLLIP